MVSTVSPQEAASAAKKILGYWDTIPASDPQQFAAGLVKTLMIFPLPVIERAIDPVMGIPGAVAYPNLAKIREHLDKWHGEYLDDIKRREKPLRIEAPPEDTEMARRVAAGLKDLANQIGRGIGPSSV